MSTNQETTPSTTEQNPLPIEQHLRDAGLVKDGDVIKAGDAKTEEAQGSEDKINLTATVESPKPASNVTELTRHAIHQQQQRQRRQQQQHIGGTRRGPADPGPWSGHGATTHTANVRAPVVEEPIDPLDIPGADGYTPRMNAWMSDPGFPMLLDILGTQRPKGSQAEWDIIQRYIYPISGITEDIVGNCVVDIGEPNGVLWSCHTDTVHSMRETRKQRLVMTTAGVLQLARTETASCLGADDGTGMWLMLQMIAGNVPGRYVFHYGEETGCIGSKSIKNNRPEVLEGIRFAIAFDRAGTHDVITHQRGARCCSDAFARSIAAQLPGKYEPCQGVYTDTAEYMGIVPECTNISVGYRGQHGSGETQNVPHLLRLRDAMLKIDPSQFVVERDPKAREVSTFRGRGTVSRPSYRQEGSQGGTSSSYSGSEEYWDAYEENMGFNERSYTAEEIERMFPKQSTTYDSKGNAIRDADDTRFDDDEIFRSTSAAPTKGKGNRVAKNASGDDKDAIRRLAQERFNASIPPAPRDLQELVKHYPEELSSVLDDMGMSVPMFWNAILSSLGYTKQ